MRPKGGGESDANRRRLCERRLCDDPASGPAGGRRKSLPAIGDRSCRRGEILRNLCQIAPPLEPIDGRHLGPFLPATDDLPLGRSEEHTSELQSLMRHSYAVSCLKNK